MSDFVDMGDIQLEDLNDMNIPVNIWIQLAADVGDALDEDVDDDDGPPDRKWALTADVYFPRRAHVASGAVLVYSDNREALARRMREVALPLYQAAVHCVEALDKPNERGDSFLYYWERK